MRKKYQGFKLTVVIMLNIILSLVLALFTFAIKDLEAIFGKVYLEQVVINMTQNVDGVDINMVKDMVSACAQHLLVILICYLVLVAAITRIKGRSSHLICTGILVFLLSACAYVIEDRYRVIEYCTREEKPSEIFEQYYVDPKEVKYIYPEENRNLIYIFSESLETSLLSKDAGGYEEESLLPRLEDLAKEHIVLSNGTGMQGSTPVHGTTWTAAAIMSHTSGVPLKSALGKQYGEDGIFAPGVYSIGELLAEKGYKNYFRMGSEATYANRDIYLYKNGDYAIYDLNYMKELDVYPPDYKVWWGHEDYELFEYAKVDLTNIASQDEPFNYTLLTADTHFPNGHVCQYCETEDERQYANVYRCQDRFLADFIEWIMQQDFYENTTIILVGDHLSMDGDFFKGLPDDAVRTPFNMIINSVAELETTTGRAFTSMDMYPTTLAAMGIEVVGDRLGLGTNLFGTRTTVLEELGFDKLEEELAGFSVFYNDKILQDPDIEYMD